MTLLISGVNREKVVWFGRMWSCH